MGTSVDHLFKTAGIDRTGAVRWGEQIPYDGPGVYVVAITTDPSSGHGHSSGAFSDDSVRSLLEVRPEATVDGNPATHESIRRRLDEMWVPNEPVLYIGLAGTSLRTRVDQYYRTRIGARAPHAGGWPIKMLADLDQLWVHFGTTDEPDGAEIAMVDAFASAIGPNVRAQLVDPGAPLPFANLMFPGGRRKHHGFAGVKESRSRTRLPQAPGPGSPPSPPRIANPTVPRLGGRRTQNVTQSDIDKGQIRIPSATKEILPSSATTITVDLRGERFASKWNPRRGPDKERSGLIRVPRSDLARLVQAGGPLTIVRTGDVFEIT